MKHIIYNTKLALVAASLLMLSACNDFLDREPLDGFTDENYWSSEANVKTYAWKFYDQFLGYGKGVGYSSEFYFQANGTAAAINISDDLMANELLIYGTNPSTTNTDWKTSYEFVRRANVMLDRIPNVPGITVDGEKHWEGVARFFRAYSYFQLIQRFGDVPYYDYEVVEPNNIQTVFLPRTNRNEVMDEVINDLTIAIEKLKEQEDANTINKDVARALKSRVCLYEGTYRKYHKNGDGAEYLKQAKEEAFKLMDGGKYRLASTFKETYNSEDLSANKEMILYKSYQLGILAHAVQAFNNSSSIINGMTKWAVDSYVCKDGLPISQSSLYQGDKNIVELVKDRDNRLTQSIIGTNISYRGIAYDKFDENDNEINVTPPLGARVSTTGYVISQFNNDKSTNVTTAGQNTIDAPIFGYAEVLLNYVEAAAELGGISNEDLKLSINLLRARAGIAELTVNGDKASAGGVEIVDPARTNALETSTGVVSSILWEIRRERRAELMTWTFIRYNDLMRWKKGAYLDFGKNPDVLLGAYIGTIPEHKLEKGKPKVPEKIVLNKDGYLISYGKVGEVLRTFDENKHYLNSIPTGQIDLYTREGIAFPQNPNW